MITLKEFINLANLEGNYCFFVSEERENCFQLHLMGSEKLGYHYLNEIEEKYLNMNISNISFSCNNNIGNILIEVE